MAAEIKAVKLYKNHIYPTYQLYAQMANKKTDPADGLRYGALLSMAWLRQRLGEDCPAELKDAPAPELWNSVSDEVLFSYHLNEGFVIDIVSAPQLGEWSLQITEPDLGTRTADGTIKRAAVPGRIIESDIAFQATGSTLNCAFKTVISDPDSEEEPAEVYRFALVKKLAEEPAFGLKQIVELDGAKRMISSKDQVRSFLELKDNASCQLPVFVFVEEKETETKAAPLPAAVKKEKEKEPAFFAGMPKKGDLSFAGKSFTVDVPLPGNSSFGSAFGKLEKFSEAPAKETFVKRCLIDPDQFAKDTLGACLVFFLEQVQIERFKNGAGISVKSGDVVMIDPASFGGKGKVIDLSGKKYDLSQARHLKALAYRWFLGKEITFGTVPFVSAARQNVFAAIDKAEQNAASMEERFKKELDLLKTDTTAALKKLKDENTQLKEQLERQKKYVTRLSGEKTDLREQHAEELKKKKTALKESEDMIAFLTRKCTRPKDMKDVADWVKKNFSERLLLHERAEDMLSGPDARETDTGLVLDALEYLAEEFYDMQFHGLGKDDANLRSSKKYGRPFEFTPVSETTYNDSGLYSQYHVSYKKDGRGKPVDRPLDMHIKCGNTSPFLVRIYFFLDKVDKKIVVGSLPGHLGTITFG